jgi:RNA-binding protein 5/10
MRDIGPNGGGNRVLLIRGLDVLTRGDEVVCRIGEEIDRLVGREQVGSILGRRAIQRVIMISDVRTKVGWGFGFVEFFQPEVGCVPWLDRRWPLQLATNLLAHLQSPVSQPRGFVLHSAPHRPVASSFANPTSFAPIDAGSESTDGCVQASGPGGIGGGAFSGWCSYWDERAEATETLGGAGDGGIDEKLDAYLASVAPAAPAAPMTEATPAEPLHKTGPISISTKAKKKEMPEIGMIPIVEKRKANVLGDDDEEEDLVGKDFVLPSRSKRRRPLYAPLLMFRS